MLPPLNYLPAAAFLAAFCSAVFLAGAKNAAYLAAQIMALADKDLDERVKANRVKACEEVIEKDRKLQEKLK